MSRTTPPAPRPRRRWPLIVLLSFTLLAAVGLAAATTVRLLAVLNPFVLLDDGRAHRSDGSTRVREVVDGDTIEVVVDGRVEKVRLLGIDTPETKDPRKPVQCFGEEASRRTGELLPPGTEVRLVGDVEERDRYDRVLAYVYRASDSLFVNLELARGGYADVLTYPPNVAHTTELTTAVAEARREQRGLWRACGGPGRPA
jgi:micrococcal nuclease